MRIIQFILLFFLSQGLKAQDWPKIFGDNLNVVSFNVFETYDHGFLIVGNFQDADRAINGWLIKTDINGEVLWHKKTGDELWYPLINVEQDSDGNFFLIGNSYEVDNYGDAMIIKLNPCGEQLWCRVFHFPQDVEYGQDIKVLPDKNIIALIPYYGADLQNERTWLFKLNPEGEIIWQKVYAQNDPKIFGDDGHEIILSSASDILISGSCYYPNPGQTNPGWLRPLWINVDQDGNELWELPWGIDEYFYGQSVNTTEGRYGNFYSAGRHTEYIDKNEVDRPALLKFTSKGKQLYYKNIVENSKLGIATTIDFLNDSTLVVGACCCMDLDTFYENCYLLDTLGNIIMEKRLITSASTIRGADVTHDGKIIMTGGFNLGGNMDIYLWKMNSNLEFDSIYTAQYNYDSLCPYQISSDTIDCNCTIVNVEEIIKQSNEELLAWVFPNPASEKFTLRLSETYLSGFNPNTNEDELLLVVFDFYGRKMHEFNLAKNAKLFTVNAEHWQKGLYLLQLRTAKRIVMEQKLIVQ
jgi:Secretion system C-terminal sorting domain